MTWPVPTDVCLTWPGSGRRLKVPTRGRKPPSAFALATSPPHPRPAGAHPACQIDGNFGATAGIAEMLLQSQNGELHLLPALPSAWPAGRVRGLRARGGVTVDIEWKNGAVEQYSLLGRETKSVAVRIGSAVSEQALHAGVPLVVRPATLPR